MPTDLPALLRGLHPDEAALRDTVRPLLTGAVIDGIAGLDHGEQLAANRDAIRELLVVRHLPRELPWPPREVLELACHTTPDTPPAHAARLFAAAVVYRAGALVPAGVLAGLVDSAIALGPATTGAAVRYLARCHLRDPDPYCLLGLLLLTSAAPHPDRSTVDTLRAAVDAAPPDLRDAGGPGRRIWQRLTVGYRRP